MSGRKPSILDLIPTGESNAISMRELARILNTDQRVVRQMIQTERIRGVVICGTDAGIFFPSTTHELRSYIHRTLSRITTSQATLMPAIKLLEELEDAHET